MKIKKYIPLFVSLILLVSVLSPITSSAAEPAKNRPQLTIGKFEKAPTIDGNITAAEWGDKSFSIGQNQPNVSVFKTEIKNDKGEVTGYKSLKDTKTDVYMGWDDTHVYLGVVAKYTDHYALAILGNQLWQDDCIQTKISATEKGTQYNDIDFGISSSTGKALAQVWNPTQGGMKYGQLQAGKGKDYMITRKGDVTTYEIAFPLKSFATTVLKLKQNDKISFSLVQHMSAKDSKGQEIEGLGAGFYEYAGGIVMDKEISKSAVVTLGAPKKLSGGNGGGNQGGSNQGGNQGGTVSSGTQGGNNSNVTSSDNNSSTGSDASSNPSDVSSDTGITSSDVTSDNSTDSSSADTAGTDTDDGSKEEKGSNNVLIIVIVCVAALAILGAAFYFLILRKR